VLSGFDELKICTHYRLPDGTISDRFIPDAVRLGGAQPVYQTLPGWTEEIDDATVRSNLPANAQSYLRFIEQNVGVPIEIVSVGPERTQTLVEV
jgi:adenylosuccinate synthase